MLDSSLHRNVQIQSSNVIYMFPLLLNVRFFSPSVFSASPPPPPPSSSIYVIIQISSHNFVFSSVFRPFQAVHVLSRWPLQIFVICASFLFVSSFVIYSYLFSPCAFHRCNCRPFPLSSIRYCILSSFPDVVIYLSSFLLFLPLFSIFGL